MEEIKVREFDDFKAPKRKPWLILAIALCMGGFVYWRWTARGQQKAVPELPVESGLKAPGAAGSTAVPKPEAPRAAPPKPTVAPRPVATVATPPIPSTPVPPPAPGGAGAPAVSSAASAMPGAAAGLLSEARALERADDLAGARARCLALLEKTTDAAGRAEIERMLGDLNMRLVMSPRPMPEKQDYVVERGDSIEKIAKQFGATPEVVQKGNNVANPRMIKAGDRFRVFTGKFSIAVSRSRNDLRLDMNGQFFKRYSVGTGKFGKTPVGMFVITEKIEEPPWWRPDGKMIPYGNQENILGTHWMTIRATGDTPAAQGYGIHGTWDESTIGSAQSAGCVRMRNAEVEELFSLVPVQTPVAIAD